MKELLMTILFLSSFYCVQAKAVTQDEMEKIVTDRVVVVENRKGYVVFDYKNIRMALVSDVEHDRMRIISPITKYSELDLAKIEKIMGANFHSALDARYASSNDVLYSAFIHPMSPLSEKELTDALNQVANLALTFGTTYTSGELSYGGK